MLVDPGLLYLGPGTSRYTKVPNPISVLCWRSLRASSICSPLSILRTCRHDASKEDPFHQLKNPLGVERALHSMDDRAVLDEQQCGEGVGGEPRRQLGPAWLLLAVEFEHAEATAAEC